MEVLPSPRLQLQAATLPSGSMLVSVKWQVRPVQLDVNDAAGGWFPGGPWQGAVPVSEKTWPASEKNLHWYPVGRSTRRNTPCALFCTTSLFGWMVPRASSPAPPVPTTNSRIPVVGSATPFGVIGANRS